MENKDKLSKLKQILPGSSLDDDAANGRNQNPPSDINPLLAKAYERFLKTEEFVSTSPLKYRRPLPTTLL